MAQVRIATAALYLGADHAVRSVGFCVDGLIFKGSGEAGPAAAGMKFCFGAEERTAAADAFVGAGSVGGLVLSRIRRLGALLTGHIILVRCELLLPFGVRLLNLFGHVSS